MFAYENPFVVQRKTVTRKANLLDKVVCMVPTFWYAMCVDWRRLRTRRMSPCPRCITASTPSGVIATLHSKRNSGQQKFVCVASEASSRASQKYGS